MKTIKITLAIIIVSVVSAAAGDLTIQQKNAMRSAVQYLQVQGFSRDGLIHQLSSNFGGGYSIQDATAAVDRLQIDWNEQAVRSARQYVQLQGFSCHGLVRQLSSDFGSKYTEAQARYAAMKIGLCK